MKWHVIKTGFPMFDVLHACGLGILMTHACESAVYLTDMGTFFEVAVQVLQAPESSPALLDDVLVLPTIDELLAFRGHKAASVPLSIANLDGLLAALFTIPGRRLVSVADAMVAVERKPEAVEEVLAKVRPQIARWMTYAKRASRRSPNWLEDVLRDYDPADPQVPTVGESVDGDVSALMTLDPAFGYSTRRPISDGLITQKTSLGIRGTRYAILLAFIGAARFLRAQRVKGNLVVFTVPVPDRVSLDGGVSMPLLQAADQPLDHVIAGQWLGRWLQSSGSDAIWRGLAYQVLQTQRAQQSISISRGIMANSWLDSLAKRGGTSAIRFWAQLLASPRDEVPFEVDELVSCLVEQHITAWLAHLRGFANFQLTRVKSNDRTYSIQEVEAIMDTMNDSTGSPLSAILARPQGTLRFGQALRLLGQFKPSALRDLTDALDAVKDRDQLVRVMAQAMAECAVASAKTEFMLVPTETDLRYMLDDVEQYGARTLATLLIILSVLRYPARVETDAEDLARCACASQTHPRR